MCKECATVKVLFEAASKDKDSRFMNYYPVMSFLQAMEEQKKLILFAGDCPTKDAYETLCSEEHYTVCHYFQCPNCNTIYFCGGCIRGLPIYKVVKEILPWKMERLFWGREGTYFQK